MKDIRIIVGVVLFFVTILLLPFYFGGNDPITTILVQIKATEMASNSSYVINSSTVPAISNLKSSTPNLFTSVKTLNVSESTTLNDSLSQSKSRFESSSVCELPQLDPWDPSIMKHVDRNYHPMKDCKPIAEILTILENGTLKLAPGKQSQLCWYRCLLPDTDKKAIREEWRFLNISAVPNCDIVETQCNTSGNVTYRRMHLQVIPQLNLTADKKINKPFQPNVFILLFDSVSRSSGIRSIPETLQVLTHNYKAFDFRGFNKVGHNSLPNGYAFLNGIRIEPLPSVDFHVDEKLPSEKPNYCKEYLDNTTFIGRNFTSAGYVSLMAEDWASGVFNWPGCYGFAKKPVTHYMRPFHLRMEDVSQDKIMLDQMRRQLCQESYQPIMEYLKDFLVAYPPSVPKFSLVWITDLAHDYMGGLYHIDKYFADFFRDYRQLLKDSFVLVMGDHGKHFGSVLQTKVGPIESANPLLYFAVPEYLTTNKQLMENLRINAANRLISHFDLFTTFLDIISVAPKTNWTDFGVYNWVEKEGLHQRQSSILRPLDPKRNCSFMQISETYCLCDTHEITVPNNNQTAIDAAIFLNKELMKTIELKHANDICANLTFKEVVKASMKKLSNGNDADYKYRITFVVSPSNGTFQADVKQYNNGFKLFSSRISRTNSYGDSSHCTSDSVLRPICYCRDRL